MSLKHFLNAVLGVFLFASCGTTYHYADFIKPSDLYVPTSVYRVGLMNRGASSGSTMPIYVDGIPVEYVSEMPKQVGDQTLTMFKKEVEKLGRYDLEIISLDGFEISDRGFMRKAYTAHQIDSICEVHNIEGLISIDGMDLSIATGGEVNVVTAVDQFGMPVRVPEFTQEQVVSYNVAWRFYVKGKSEAIDIYDEVYKGYFNQKSYSPVVNTQETKDNIQFGLLAQKAALDYHNRVSPYWEEDHRLYYRTDGKLASISSNLEYNGNWEAAASEWLRLTTDEEQTVRYQAKYNMAVASEMLGRPKLAKDWLLKAQAEKLTKQSEKYMVILDQQILIYDVIDAQLGYSE